MGVRLLQDGVAFLQGVLGGAEGLSACSQGSSLPESSESNASTSLDSYQAIISGQPWTAVSVQSSAVKWFDPELCEIDPNETPDASVPEKLQLFEEKLLQAEEYVALSYQDASVLKQFNTSAEELQSEAIALADEVLGLAKQDSNPEVRDRNWYLYFRKEMLELAIKEFELQQLGGADSQVLATRQGEIQKGRDRVIQGLKAEARSGNGEAGRVLLKEAQLQALTVWATYEQEREKIDPTKNALFVRISELVQSGRTETLQGAVAFLIESSASEDQIYKSYLSEVQNDRLVGKLLYLTSEFPFPYQGQFTDAAGDFLSPISLALKLEAEGGYVGTVYQLHGLTKVIDLENKVQSLVDSERLSLEGKKGFWSDFGRGAYHAIRTTSLPEVALFHALPLGIALRIAGKAQAAKLTSLAAKGATGLPAVAMGQGIRFGVAGGLLWGWNTATMAGGAWVQGKDVSKVLTPKALGMGLLSSILSIAGIELSGKLGTQIGMKSAAKLKWASVENGIPNLTIAGTTLTKGMHHLFAYSGMTGTHWLLNWHLDGTSAGRGLVDYWAFPMAMKANEVFFPAMAKSGRRLHQEIAYLEQALMRPMGRPNLGLTANTANPVKTYAIEPIEPLTEGQRSKASAYFDKWNEQNIFGGKAERNWMAMAEGPNFKRLVRNGPVVVESPSKVESQFIVARQPDGEFIAVLPKDLPYMAEKYATFTYLYDCRWRVDVGEKWSEGTETRITKLGQVFTIGGIDFWFRAPDPEMPIHNSSMSSGGVIDAKDRMILDAQASIPSLTPSDGMKIAEKVFKDLGWDSPQDINFLLKLKNSESHRLRLDSYSSMYVARIINKMGLNFPKEELQNHFLEIAQLVSSFKEINGEGFKYASALVFLSRVMEPLPVERRPEAFQVVKNYLSHLQGMHPKIAGYTLADSGYYWSKILENINSPYLLDRLYDYVSIQEALNSWREKPVSIDSVKRINSVLRGVLGNLRAEQAEVLESGGHIPLDFFLQDMLAPVFRESKKILEEHFGSLKEVKKNATQSKESDERARNLDIDFLKAWIEARGGGRGQVAQGKIGHDLNELDRLYSHLIKSWNGAEIFEWTRQSQNKNQALSPEVALTLGKLVYEMLVDGRDIFVATALWQVEKTREEVLLPGGRKVMRTKTVADSLSDFLEKLEPLWRQHQELEDLFPKP